MTVKALVVGLGSIGQRHARVLRSLLGPELELSAVRSRGRSQVVTDALSASAGDPAADCDGGVFPTLAEALEHHPDLVVVATPSSLHVPAAVAAVQGGAAVLVEKPLSDELQEADLLRRTAGARGAVVAVGFQLRFHPALRRLRELVDGGAVGTLLKVDAEVGEYLPSFHPYEDYRQSYAARRDLGGGVVLTQIHELDYLQWIFGAPSGVWAVGGRLGSLDIDVEDTASALLRHEHGGRPVPVHVHLDFLQRPARRTCRVVGEAGTIEVDLRSPSLVWSDGDGRVMEATDFPGFERARMFVEQMESFLGAWRGEHPVEVDLDQAVVTMRTAEAVKRSLQTGAYQPLA